MEMKSFRLALIAFFLSLSISLYIFQIGLDGWFIADDFPNLSNLSEIKKEPNLDSYSKYIFNGATGNLGRPLSYLSFALQHESWPNNPKSFKLGNLIIHLTNGLLIAILTFNLIRLSSAKITEQWILFLAVSTALLWIIHPIQASTVLYTVQRMNELSSFFILLASNIYLLGRTIKNKLLSYLLLSLALGPLLVLGVLSKENAILLPAFILLIEFLFIKKNNRDKIYYYWASLFLIAPLLALTLYFYSKGFFIDSYTSRNFNATERLLTQPRVLFDYLGKILLPTPSKFSFFYDDFLKSTSLLQPISTIYSIAGILLSILGAILVKGKHPLISFGIFWFFIGHSLEASSIPLELYYNHRNYLPLMGITLIISYCFFLTVKHSKKKQNSYILILLFIIYLLFIGFITHKEAKLWSNPFVQALTWAHEKPLSRRAQDHYAATLIIAGEYNEAISIYQNLETIFPMDATPRISMLETQCISGEKHIDIDSDYLNLTLKASRYGFGPLSTLNSIAEQIETSKCKRYNLKDLLAITNNLISNTNFSVDKYNLLSIMARFHWQDANYKQAIHNYEVAYRNTHKIPFLLDLSVMYIQTGQDNKANILLQEALKSDQIRPQDKLVYWNVIHDLIEQIATHEDK
jgi:hypothetical protein